LKELHDGSALEDRVGDGRKNTPKKLKILKI
jgi:hypothetical protein